MKTTSLRYGAIALALALLAACHRGGHVPDTPTMQANRPVAAAPANPSTAEPGAQGGAADR